MNHRRKIEGVISASAVAVALAWILSAVASAGTIAESPHDFRGYKWNESGQICMPCHTPHQSKTLSLPLWNPRLETDTYTMYAAVRSVETAEDTDIRPKDSSKICLSCHDGTVAPETFGEISGEGSMFYQAADFDTGKGGNHPVSFVYDTSLAVADGELFDPSAKLSGVADSTGSIRDDMLFDDRMECSSCHDVHNTRAVAGTKLLLKDTAGSALCFTCHDK